ncbi:MAG TPA: OmpA family protein [Terriglobales bacterium]|nr:OmpA family protein [Terriglobales bacterium]
MKPRSKNTPRLNQDRWLVSYADFITLLFAFFVVLYAAAEVDKKKTAQIAISIQTAFQQLGALPARPLPYSPPTAAPQSIPAAQVVAPENKPSDDLTDLQNELQQALASEIARGEVVVRPGTDGITVSLREIGFFESGSAGMKARSQAAFQRMAKLLAQHKFSIRIEGHTDNVPIHNSQFASNWELSTARATEMVRLLITEYQIPPAQLSAAGYGEFHPIASNETAEGRAQNRRVDVAIVGKVGDASARK